MKHTKLGRLFEGIKKRCCNPKSKGYNNYGGRGIKVLWENFKDFKTWALEHGYKPGLEIDRINNNGHYSPDNCRFVTHSENNLNKRKRCDNTSGFTGVYKHSQNNCYSYELQIGGVRYRKSGFLTAESAYKARQELIKKLNINYNNE